MVVPDSEATLTLAGGSAFAAYSLAITEQLAAQLERFIKLNPHQLAGHVANLEFWSSEVGHCLQVLDQYTARFDQLAAAQRKYVDEHHTVQFSLRDKYLDSAQAPTSPRRIPDGDRRAARSSLCESFYRFIVRCRSAGLIDDARARAECERHSISVDSSDLRNDRDASEGEPSER